MAKEYEVLVQLLKDKSKLKDMLSFVAIYVCIYEKYKDILVARIKELFTTYEVKDGQLIEKVDSCYEQMVRRRDVDGKGNRNVLLSTMLYFVDLEAITMQDYELFLRLRNKRNTYAHEMTSVILQDLTEEDVVALLDMLELFKKLDEWWLTEYEASIMSIPPENHKDGYSLAFGVYIALLQKLFDIQVSNKRD